MAKRSFQATNLTYTAQADTTALSSNSYMSLAGGTTTQLIDVLEILISGFSTASTVAIMQWARASTLAVGPSALVAPHSDGPMHPATAALGTVPVSFVAAATSGPQRSAVLTDARLNLGLNTFGGIIRWNAAPTQQWSILGSTTTSLSESVLSCSNSAGGGNGIASAHIIYEPY